MKVSVSILKNKDKYKETIKRLNDTHADYIHLDILDETFTSEPSFELKSFSKLKVDKLYDIHIMSTNLEFQINEAIKLNPALITLQYEAINLKEIDKYLDLIRENGILVLVLIKQKNILIK